MASKLNLSISNFKDYLNPVVNFNFSFVPVTESTVLNFISSLKASTSAGFDDISTNILKKIAPVIIQPLTVIINQSLISVIFPSKLKISKVIPIFKKGDSRLISNYRPISILPSFSKVFEKVVYLQLYSYFSDNNLFFSSQYGFRSLHSTEYGAIKITDKILSEMDKGNTPLAIFLDLSRAFDILDHHMLLEKLNNYGIQNNSLNWFSSYLTNRKQFVQIESTRSQACNMPIGVPQGSILGPLLFIIYMNDIHKSSTFFDFILYADDTTLFNPFGDTCSVNVVNSELNKIFSWLCANKLSINVTKSK